MKTFGGFLPGPRERSAVKANYILAGALCAALLLAVTFSFAQQGSGYLEQLLDRGLSMDSYESRVLLQKASEAHGADAASLLADAAAISPNLPAVHLRLALVKLPDAFESISELIAAAEAYKHSFWWSMSLRGSAIQAFVAATLLGLAVLIAVRLAADLPLLMHDINEKRPRLILPALMIPCSVLGPALVLLAALMTMCLYARKGLAVFYLAAALAFALPVLQGQLDAAYSASMPRMAAIVGVNEGSDNSYAIGVLSGYDDYMSRFAYGLALRRVGRVEESVAVYRKLLQETPGDRRSLVNLGNAQFTAGRFNEARDSYQKAYEIEKTAVSAYNLSMASRALFDYASGDKFYGEAAALDSQVVSSFNSIASKNPNRTVMDSVFTKDRLEDYISQNGTNAASLYPMGNKAAMAGAGALAVIFTVLQFSGMGLAGRCTNCGNVLCERCAPSRTYAGKCASCHRLLAEFDDTSPRAKVARMLSSMRIKDKLRDRLKALSFAPPGMAQIYAGKLFEGYLYLVGFLYLVFAAILAADPVFTVGLVGLTHVWLTPFLAAGAVLLYLLSFLSVNRRLEIGWL